MAREVTALLLEARRAAGLPPLEPRAPLAAVAAAAAGAIAALPEDERLSHEFPPVENALRDAGLPAVRRARTHVDLQTGSPRPAAATMRRWRDYEQGWRDALDPGMDAVGIGAAVSDDDWIVLVAILVDDLPGAAGLREMERRIEEEVNLERQAAGLTAMEGSHPLTDLARAHSEDMAARDYFAHESPEGRDVAGRAREAGIGYRIIAENIARSRGVEDAVRTALEAWRRSRDHRRNMLNPEVTVTGVGAAAGADGTIYFTQVFLLPAE